MANEDIGTIECSVNITGKIRRKKSGKYPLYVNDKSYGNLFFQTELGQDFILENCSMFGADGDPDPGPAADPDPGPAADPDPAPAADPDPGPAADPDENETGFML